MSGGHSKSESDNESGFDQKVWAPQGDALQNLYGQLGDLWGQMSQGMQNQIPGATDWMNQIRNQSQPYWNNMMQGGAYQGMDLQGMYNNALGGGGNEQFVNEQIMGGKGNDYADAMKSQIMGDAQTAQDQMTNISIVPFLER